MHASFFNHRQQLPSGSGRPFTSGTVKTPTTSWPSFFRVLYTSAPNWLCPMMATFSFDKTNWKRVYTKNVITYKQINSN